MMCRNSKQQPMKILHLEDSSNDAALISAALCDEVSNCIVTRVETRNAFIEALDCDDWDLILADYSLPSFDGISALKLAVAKRPDLPFIFVTGFLGEERAVETLKNGATDYILKHRLDRLPQAVIRARRECEAADSKRKAEQKLRDSLRERELLLQEVHHRVNNNLQIINSLLDMQADAFSNDQRIACALQESRKRVQCMAMIHGMLYDSGNVKDVDFAEYVRSLMAEMVTSYGIDPDRIRITLELEPIRLEIHHAIPCGLIVNELASNAFKHGFPNSGSGEVRVLLQQQGRRILLAVEDTGVGITGDHIPRERKSLGLILVDILTRQLNGRMETTSKQGTHFSLEFELETSLEPLAYEKYPSSGMAATGATPYHMQSR